MNILQSKRSGRIRQRMAKIRSKSKGDPSRLVDCVESSVSVHHYLHHDDIIIVSSLDDAWQNDVPLDLAALLL